MYKILLASPKFAKMYKIFKIFVFGSTGVQGLLHPFIYSFFPS